MENIKELPFKLGDNVEFLANYSVFNKGDKATVISHRLVDDKKGSLYKVRGFSSKFKKTNSTECFSFRLKLALEFDQIQHHPLTSVFQKYGN